MDKRLLALSVNLFGAGFTANMAFVSALAGIGWLMALSCALTVLNGSFAFVCLREISSDIQENHNG